MMGGIAQMRQYGVTVFQKMLHGASEKQRR